jgi:predicted lipoprotein with Yx(FWY)xxD motif
MARLLKTRRPRRMHLAFVVAAIAGILTAGLVGMAVAKTLTLQVAKNATVMSASGSTTHANIVTNAKAHAVYTLSGDTTTHPKCTKANGCFGFWPPVTVSSAKSLSKASGISGKLGTFKRNGLTQVTLNGHPLYNFSPDKKKNIATGEGIHGFSGVWHVVKGPKSSSNAPNSPTPTTTSTPTMTSPIPGY